MGRVVLKKPASKAIRISNLKSGTPPTLVGKILQPCRRMAILLNCPIEWVEELTNWEWIRSPSQAITCEPLWKLNATNVQPF